MLPGVGTKAAEKLWQKFSGKFPKTEAETSNATSETGETTPQPARLATQLQKCVPAVPKKTAASWAELVIAISQLESEPVRSKPSEMVRHVLEAGYQEYLQDNFANYRTRLEDLQQLATFALQFTSTEEFLTQLSLLTSLEAEDERPATADNELIRLSTIHQAKGLEFDVVFVIMLCDGLFPSSRSIETTEGLEEERRLFYVAITRARDELYLSYPLVRTTPGSGGGAMQMASRFMREIPKEFVEEWNLRSYPPYG
jgi:DNA helicase-2/ATP-dependent DNA helicase PcrA